MAPIYFDYASSTPVDPKVQEVMIEALQHQANPHNMHNMHGAGAAQTVKKARGVIAQTIGAEPKDIIWG